MMLLILVLFHLSFWWKMGLVLTAINAGFLLAVFE